MVVVVLPGVLAIVGVVVVAAGRGRHAAGQRQAVFQDVERRAELVALLQVHQTFPFIGE
jgi:hypothetical protein